MKRYQYLSQFRIAIQREIERLKVVQEQVKEVA
jgi:uncharacterized protein YnzC (UPF0291/DUF896 family)